MSGAASSGDGRQTPPVWTPANIVTCARVAAVPLWLLVAEMSPATGVGSSWSAGVFLLFVALSLTDKLDGYLARSRDEVTTFGKFLDPIADKLVVVVALCFLLERGVVCSWVLLVVVAREFLVSGLRMVVATSGTVIAASPLGKGKTAVTMAAISVLLLAMALPAGDTAGALGLLGQALMVAAVVLTAWSGIDYFVKSWPYVAGGR
ncbi:MAG: CDP-diacylglycerol--glycerol-3-phosphate 3-phosphatidyltransferase [Coriobacteriaceae bacterium]|nr:CDP-diacylglycerol--glycerol-3-phosphate 3-phosphatidyltransferase [Coriobacteriaceae bacterium]MDD7583420.1 CDP-diacylglycerol--glycerol-3-phosphate 3-phosphatidyltransferase [Coriobacteriaceae bacterium]